MGSLFTKVFLSFWLAALLLGATFFAIERFYGEEAVVDAQRRMDARAATAAALWREGGRTAVMRWLQDVRHRPFLVDARANPMLRPRLPRPLAEVLSRPPEPGAHPLRRGHYAVVARLPDVEPPLFLVSFVDDRSGHHLPVGARIGIAILITGLVSLGLSGLLTRRLRRLRRAAQSLAEGDLSVRVGHRGRDEVAALSRDFDLMAERLNELLEGQRRLLQDVSHELRSPLARLRVALELAERAEDPAQAVARIGKEADALERLVGDVLSLARLESGQTALERRPLDLAEVVGAVVQDADFEARARGRIVRLAATEAAPVHGDPVLLRAAVENVVRNAVRHTAEGTPVEVGLRAAAGEAALTVRDHGPGVPEAELERVFQAFTRIGEARDRGSGGYGLGLAITARAVEAHGGRVAARNLPEGGFEVAIRLPLTEDPQPRSGTE